MENIENTWTYEEFLAYVLFYAANADLEIKPEEREYIIEKVDTKIYSSIKKEFGKDNDYWQLEKIRSYCSANLKTAECREKLYADIEALLASDGKYSSIEKNFFNALKKVLG
ncbi:MAG TPA: hypothetical protein PLZ52_03970 [Bacteroidales bacterium]|nr:hypothetical protein [Bacteroidales bacterium]HOE04350.1 hypothetical protein [Bacteroidales bacterium]HQL70539.1 hypothetical protein [Bacteroidales bacterium]